MLISRRRTETRTERTYDAVASAGTHRRRHPTLMTVGRTVSSVSQTHSPRTWVPRSPVASSLAAQRRAPSALETSHDGRANFHARIREATAAIHGRCESAPGASCNCRIRAGERRARSGRPDVGAGACVHEPGQSAVWDPMSPRSRDGEIDPKAETRTIISQTSWTGEQAHLSAGRGREIRPVDDSMARLRTNPPSELALRDHSRANRALARSGCLGLVSRETSAG